VSERLLTILQKLKTKHYECEDCWYSCPKSEEGCCNEYAEDICTCGADRQNALVDEATSIVAQLTAENEQLKQEVAKEAAWNEALSDNNELQFQYGEKLTAERDELREQLAAQETISEIQQMALQDKNSFAELQMRGKLSERITELEAALDKAVETIGSVIGCCTYGSNEEAKQGAYGISHQAFTKIDEFIKYLYNHADIDHTISTDVLMNIKTSSDNNKCIWVELDDPDIVLWATSCGNEFHIEYDKPSDNHMKYCCYCGKEIAEGE